MAEEPDGTPIDTSPPPPALRPKRRLGRRFAYSFLALWLTVALWNLFKPLPNGVSVRGAIVDTPLSQLRFLNDVTSADVFGAPVVRQQIFDAVLALVGEAREYLVLDFFLFNGQRGATAGSKPHRELSIELRDALLARKRAQPQIHILVIADPINDVYGGLPSRDLAALRGAGIDVVTPDLDALRDSNPIYSAFWRLTMKWWSGDGSGDANLPNPLDAGPDRVSFGAWARLLNFKADHRKVIIGDDGKGGMTGIVTSANPHDASSLHSNVALQVGGAALAPLLDSELALAADAGWVRGWQPPEVPASAAASPDTTARVQVLTEGEIAAALVRNFGGARVGDGIDIAMFYLSERNVIQALLAAAKRGVAVRVILDPNKDAFGQTKNGIPNRSVATELAAASDGAIKVRWFRTHGEQFHSKLVAMRTANEFWFTLGSANLTRRNLENYNLEANVAASVPPNAEIASQISAWFDSLWTNRGPPELEYTAEFGTYADPSQGSYWLYRLMEATGLSTF
ncbi:MAG TPA: phospholipase D-like domain-containing protein [Steroidobacteraceae bacterium]|jgi:phosphatidylserine/phosphatidylglycerophosphate/cardiolipin synthase-like enzyme|nr:phospholipase D-like domain-containing protein [Steroidobacteraceae bacterium]